MAKIDPRNFLLNTDYETDKIILIKTGDFIGSIDIPHSLSFTPLIFGVWSTDKNFISGNTLGVFSESSPIPGLYTPPLGVSCIALEKKIRLEASGEDSDTQKIYYRVYAFAPDNIGAQTPITANQANQFILNTDYNYRKIKKTGEFTQGGKSYKHNLGYIPQVMAWIKYAELPNLPNFSKGIEPVVDISYFTDYRLEITESVLKADANFPFGLIEKIIWRVYYDEA
ncbi:hypothetical protein IJH24_03660 [Candidatus Saccharibacteria bacterium]|nr:hypothetical protein [Candidatus Saccharibacteria bacterium]